MSFAEATAVTASGDGTFTATIHDGWDIGGNANGGYLLAIATRALLVASGRDDPVSVTAHYLRPGRPGPVTIDTEVVKEGRTFATVRGTLLDVEGRPLLTLLGTFGTLADGPDTMVDGAPPDLPSFEDCRSRRAATGEDNPPGLMSRIDLRLHPDDAGFASGQRSGVARIRGWFRLEDDEPLDTMALLQAADAFPPTIFNTDIPVAWIPTLELTAHVRARPASGPLRAVFTTRFVTGGFLEEDGEVWDSAGRLVAQSRQLALLPRV